LWGGEEEGWFQNATVWKVGVGDKARFWEEAWTYNNNLKSLYPRLYSLSMDQGMTIGEVGSWVDSGWQWRLNWRRARFKWESELEEDMLSILNRGVMNRKINYHLVWEGDSKGVFSVKYAYVLLDCHSNSPADGVFVFYGRQKLYLKL